MNHVPYSVLLNLLEKAAFRYSSNFQCKINYLALFDNGEEGISSEISVLLELSKCCQLKLLFIAFLFNDIYIYILL